MLPTFPTVKPGVKTSELWVIVATLVIDVAAAIATMFGAHIPADAAHIILVANLLAPFYTGFRTWAKKVDPQLGNQLPDLNGDDTSPAAPALGAVEVLPALADSFPPDQVPAQAMMGLTMPPLATVTTANGSAPNTFTPADGDPADNSIAA